MKKVTLFFVILTMISTAFAMTDRYSISKYQKLEDMPAFSKPTYGVQIFNSAGELSGFMMARVKAPEPPKFDFSSGSLLVAYLGKDYSGKCIEITRIDETHKYFVVYAEPVVCSDKWNHPYIYFKLKKTDKIAKIIVK